MSSDVNQNFFASSNHLVERSYLVMRTCCFPKQVGDKTGWWRRRVLPSDRNKKTICTNLKIHLAANTIGCLLLRLGQPHRHHYTPSPRPSTEVTCFDDIGQTRRVLPVQLATLSFDCCYLAILPFRPKRDHMTFSYPWQKLKVWNAPLETNKIYLWTWAVEISKESGQGELSDRAWNL